MLISMGIAVVVLVVGFIALIKGADLFVEGSSAIAKRFRIPSIVIGLTIAAMGTSLPELAVSVSAAWNGHSEMAISNVTGSNLFNLLVVAGVCALYAPLTVQRSNRMVEFPLCILAVVLMAFFGATGTGMDGAFGSIGRAEGIAFLALFVLFLAYTVRSALKSRSASEEEDADEEALSLGKSVIGLTAIKFGGDFVVGVDAELAGFNFSYGAVAIARVFGMSDTLIGLTIVAVGTSLPELVTSIVAAKKNEVDMAIGNILGSNIFNVLFILGTTVVITPVSFVMENFIDTCILIAASIMVWIFTWTEEKLVRWEGAVMVLCYALFLSYAVARVYFL